MPTFNFNKVVRDGLPAIYKQLDEKIVFQKLGGQKLRMALASKLPEETAEYMATKTKQGRLKELADAMQVIHNLAELDGHTIEGVEHIRQLRERERGGFKDGIFVETITLRPDDPWVDYYRNETEKYPEVLKHENNAKD